MPDTATAAASATSTSIQNQHDPDTIQISRVRLAQLEQQRRVDAGRRRIIARALRAQGFTGAEIARLTGVSASQAYKDLG